MSRVAARERVRGGSVLHRTIRDVRQLWSGFRLARLAYFCVHLFVHVFAYAVPRFLLRLYFIWPVRIVGGAAVFVGRLLVSPTFSFPVLSGQGSAWGAVCGLAAAWPATPAEERALKIIAHPTDHRTLEAFGLSPCHLSLADCQPRAVSASPDSPGAAPARESGVGAGVTARTAYTPLLYRGPLYEGNIQTILGAFRAFDPLTYRREVVRSFDGNPICLDYLFPETQRQQRERHARRDARLAAATTAARRPSRPPRKRRPIEALVVILPGLTGSSREFYVQRMAKALYNADTLPTSPATADRAAETADPAARSLPSLGPSSSRRDSACAPRGAAPSSQPRGSATRRRARREYNNIQIVVLNARGVADTPLEQPQTFSALFTQDLRHVLNHELTRERVRDKFGLTHDVPVVGLAFSLGGIILANYCGEEGLRELREAEDGDAARTADAHNVLDAAITVTSPHDLLDADKAMNSFITNLIYGRTFYEGLHSYYTAHKDVIERLPGIKCREELFVGRGRGQPPRIDSIRTVREFDNAITGPHFGYDTCFDYYAAADNFRRFPFSLRTKLMSVVARNDPICGPPQPSSRYAQCAIDIECNKASLRARRRQQRPSADADADAGPDAYTGGLVSVEMPVGGHLGFVGSPLAELLGRPNDMEKFVAASLRSVVSHWYMERGRESGEQLRARANERDDDDETEDDDDDESYSSFGTS